MVFVCRQKASRVVSRAFGAEWPSSTRLADKFEDNDCRKPLDSAPESISRDLNYMYTIKKEGDLFIVHKL